MNRFFGTSKPKGPKPNLQSAITGADDRVGDLELKIKKLDVELMRFKDQYKGMREGPSKNLLKQRISRALQQRNTYNSQRDSIQNQIYTMEQTQFTTETIRSSIVTVQAMKDASKELKKDSKKVNVEQIEDLQDELEDLMQDSNDIQEALGRGYDVPEEFDDLELEAELDALGAELAYEESNEIPSYLQDNTAEFNPQPLPSFADELDELDRLQEKEGAEANTNGLMKAN